MPQEAGEGLHIPTGHSHIKPPRLWKAGEHGPTKRAFTKPELQWSPANDQMVIPGFLELPQEAHIPFPFIFSSSAGPGKAASSWQTTYSRRPRSC